MYKLMTPIYVITAGRWRAHERGVHEPSNYQADGCLGLIALKNHDFPIHIVSVSVAEGYSMAIL